MINNLRHIKVLFDFETEDDFYHLQVLKRKKENPELGSNSYLVKAYQITSGEYLEQKMPEIINLCEFHNARAYINLNRRSFEKVARHTLFKVMNQVVLNQDYYSVRKAYDSVCGGVNEKNESSIHGGVINEPKGNRKWVVDIDTKDDSFINEVAEFIESIEPVTNAKILTLISTLNGVHLITLGFNSSIFKERYPELDIHKNNPTILYTS